MSQLEGNFLVNLSTSSIAECLGCVLGGVLLISPSVQKLKLALVCANLMSLAGSLTLLIIDANVSRNLPSLTIVSITLMNLGIGASYVL